MLTCDAPYSVDQMLADLSEVESALRQGNDEGAGQAALQLEKGLVCMDSVLPRAISGRTLRAIGAGLAASGEVDRGGDWLRTAIELDPAFLFGMEDLPEVHPVRDLYEQARSSSESAPVQGAVWSSAGSVWLDGRALAKPGASLERLHLVQLEAEGEVRSWVIEGNHFPDELLAEPAPEEPVKVSRRAVRTDESGAEILKPVWPWEKTALLLGGGATSALAGAVYLLHLQELSKFHEATSPEDLQLQHARTNQLYVASLAILAVGTGTFTWGAILDGGLPTPAVRVRF
jgi:hypothetical protein